MAEYSKSAHGSFYTTGTSITYPILLPFVPDKVEVWNLTNISQPSGVNGYAYALWNRFMQSGDSAIYGITATGSPAIYPLVPSSRYPTGIQVFSGGLSQQYGPSIAITNISKDPATPTVTTTNPHGLSTGNVVIFQETGGMPQIDGIPFSILVTGNSTFKINWNTNGTNYTAASSGDCKQVIYPFLYVPGDNVVAAIGLGTTTTVTTTMQSNFVVGQQVAFRIPTLFGTSQLNSLPNKYNPGSPLYGIVTSVTTANNANQFTVDINSTNFTAYTSDIPVKTAGVTYPQVLAVGDINSGGWPYTYLGSSYPQTLYPSPQVNGASTINGPGLMGAFFNNTSQGFIIGTSISSSAGAAIYWEATYHDYSYGVQFPQISTT